MEQVSCQKEGDDKISIMFMYTRSATIQCHWALSQAHDRHMNSPLRPSAGCLRLLPRLLCCPRPLPCHLLVLLLVMLHRLLLLLLGLLRSHPLHSLPGFPESLSLQVSQEKLDLMPRNPVAGKSSSSCWGRLRAARGL